MVAERDHVANLQCVFPHYDTLHEQIQQHLFLLERGLSQSRANTLAKRGQAGQHFVGSEPLAA